MTNQQQFDDSNHQQDQCDQEQAEQPDSIQLLCDRLGRIESALGLSDSPNSGALLHRLTEIENRIGQDPRESNLPKTITRAEAASRQFLLRNKIRLEDIASGKVTVNFDL